MVCGHTTALFDAVGFCAAGAREVATLLFGGIRGRGQWRTSIGERVNSWLKIAGGECAKFCSFYSLARPVWAYFRPTAGGESVVGQWWVYIGFLTDQPLDPPLDPPLTHLLKPMKTQGHLRV
jgi:hypothetical protein